jgi:hypothetical protein
LELIITQTRIVFLKPPRFFYRVETIHDLIYLGSTLGNACGTIPAPSLTAMI